MSEVHNERTLEKLPAFPEWLSRRPSHSLAPVGNMPDQHVNRLDNQAFVTGPSGWGTLSMSHKPSRTLARACC